MVIVFKLIIATSLLVLGWKIVTAENMALEKIGIWANKKVDDGNKLYEWLICQWCMPSVWGILGYSISIISGIVKFKINIVYEYPLVVCGSSLVCGFTWLLYETLANLKQSLSNSKRYFDNNSEKAYLEVKKMKADYNSKNKR